MNSIVYICKQSKPIICMKTKIVKVVELSLVDKIRHAAILFN